MFYAYDAIFYTFLFSVSIDEYFADKIDFLLLRYNLHTGFVTD